MYIKPSTPFHFIVRSIYLKQESTNKSTFALIDYQYLVVGVVLNFIKKYMNKKTERGREKMEKL